MAWVRGCYWGVRAPTKRPHRKLFTQQENDYPTATGWSPSPTLPSPLRDHVQGAALHAAAAMDTIYSAEVSAPLPNPQWGVNSQQAQLG